MWLVGRCSVVKKLNCTLLDGKHTMQSVSHSIVIPCHSTHQVIVPDDSIAITVLFW